EEPAFADVAPPEIPSGDSEAAVLETFDFEAPARAPSDEASILPEIPMDVGLEPGPAQAFRAPEPDVASAPDFEAAADRWADHGRLPSPGTGEGRGEGSFLDGLNDSGIEGLEGR